MSYITDAMQPEPKNIFEPRLKFEGDLDRETVKRCQKYFDPDDEYYEKMQQILFGYPHLGIPREPSQIMGHLWMGTTANAENHALLKKLKITHVLDCEGYRHTHKPLVNPYKDIGMKEYTVLEAIDDEFYNIIKNLGNAFAFIDRARERGGRVLVHSRGCNLASTVIIGYLVRGGMPLLQATKRVKQERRTTLCNHNFMKQLVLYARTRGLLDADMKSIKTHAYGGAIDRRRINSSHLPNVLGPCQY